jgi:hypothetical protein
MKTTVELASLVLAVGVSLIVQAKAVTRGALIGAHQGGLGEEVWATSAKQISGDLECPASNL